MSTGAKNAFVERESSPGDSIRRLGTLGPFRAAICLLRSLPLDRPGVISVGVVLRRRRVSRVRSSFASADNRSPMAVFTAMTHLPARSVWLLAAHRRESPDLERETAAAAAAAARGIFASHPIFGVAAA